MHIASDSVSHHLADDSVTVVFGMTLDRRRQVAQAPAVARVFYPFEKTFARHVDKFLSLGRYLTDGKRTRRVALPTVFDNAHVNRHDVALA